MAWLLRNVDNPMFRGLVIRVQAEDLKEFCDRAYALYSQLGAEMVGRPPEFRFPSGAIIRTGHLQDSNAFSKYQGWEIHQLVLEEGTLIPREEDYVKLLGSLRSSYPEIPTQVFATTRIPVDLATIGCESGSSELTDYRGKFQQSLTSRYCMDKKGLAVPHLYPFKRLTTTSISRRTTRIRRIPRCAARERSEKRGDSETGMLSRVSYFYRVPTEPQRRASRPQAMHIVPSSSSFPKYCPRWIGWDWGYSRHCYLLRMAQTEDTRFHIYREMVAERQEVGRNASTARRNWAR
jgi:hypothetical protein